MRISSPQRARGPLPFTSSRRRLSQAGNVLDRAWKTADFPAETAVSARPDRPPRSLAGRRKRARSAGAFVRRVRAALDGNGEGRAILAARGAAARSSCRPGRFAGQGRRRASARRRNVRPPGSSGRRLNGLGARSGEPVPEAPASRRRLVSFRVRAIRGSLRAACAASILRRSCEATCETRTARATIPIAATPENSARPFRRGDRANSIASA